MARLTARHLRLVVDDKEAVRAALADAGVDVAPTGGLRFDDPWGNSIEIVDYRDVQFTKTPRILSALAPEGLEKCDAARAELARKGLDERVRRSSLLRACRRVSGRPIADFEVRDWQGGRGSQLGRAPRSGCA